MKRTIQLLLCVLLILPVFFAPVEAVGTNYAVYEGKPIYLPEVYEHVSTITGIPSKNSKALSNPNDVFVDSENNLYIADSGNDRILKLDRSGKLLLEISSFEGDSFINPTGVFVDESGKIYVTDTGNYRILIFDRNGQLLEEKGKPESNLLSSLSVYMPDRVVYSPKTKCTYVIAGKQLLSMDADNGFQGYFGAERVAFSLHNFLVRRFGSKEKIDGLSQTESVAYSNICVYNSCIYAVTLGKKNNIKILNGLGNNIYPSGNYGEITVDVAGKTVYDPDFCDIAVEPNGNLLVAQANNSRIYAYDSEGNMLFSFGGVGDTAGRFKMISSMAIDRDGRLYVLDSAKNNLQVLQPTYFTEQIYKGNSEYNAGEYGTSLKTWQNIAASCPGYSLAQKKIGDIKLKDKEYEIAADFYKKAKDRSGFAKSYEQMRTSFMKKHFYLVAFGIVLMLAALYYGVSGYKKYYKKLERELFFEKHSAWKTFAKLFAVQPVHPLVCYERIKANRSRIPLIICLVPPALVPMVCLFKIAAGNYAYTGTTLTDSSLLYESAVILIPLILWIGVSYLVTSLMSGEATLKETIAAACYSLTPWIVFSPVLTLLSHLSGASDMVFFRGAEIFLIVLVIIDILVAFGTMNDYSFGKTVLVTTISLFGMVIICLAVLLFASLTVQTVQQISAIIHELNTMA